MITAQLLEKVTEGKASNKLVGPLTDALNDILPVYGINTPLRVSHFIGQIAIESGYLNTLVENLNYSEAGLRQTFKKYFTPAQAKQYARKPRAIANHAYANRGGNGNEASGDGWRYRGRGWIQLTLKDNYARVGKAIGYDLVANPDLAADPRIAVMCAAEYWKKNGINKVADQDNHKAVTKKINTAMLHLSERIEVTEACKRALGWAPVPLLSPEASEEPAPAQEASVAAPNAVGDAVPDTDPVITPQSSGFLVSALQTELKAKGYYDGAIDGSWADESLTDDAVALLQKRNGMEIGPDAIRLSEVRAAKPYIVATRVDATVETLKERGDPETTFFGRVKAGAKWALGLVGLGGGAAAVQEGEAPTGVIDKASDTLGLLERGQALVAPVAAPLADTFFFVLQWIWIPVLIGIPAAWLWSRRAEKRRLAAFKAGLA